MCTKNIEICDFSANYWQRWTKIIHAMCINEQLKKTSLNYTNKIPNESYIFFLLF